MRKQVIFSTSLTDAPAADFAAEFYKEVVAGLSNDDSVSVAKVLSKVRKRFYTNKNPTFMAYVYYGDVNLRFVTPP